MSVKQPLTRKRARRDTSNEQYAAFAARIAKGYASRVADGDIMDLADLLEYQTLVDELVGQAVRDIRERGSYSWSEIGKVSGRTKQAAQQRWGKPVT